MKNFILPALFLFLSIAASGCDLTAMRFAWTAHGCYSRGQYAEAEVLYSKAIESHPSYASGYVCRANCLMRLGQYEDAVRAFADALRLNPGSVHNATLTGHCAR